MAESDALKRIDAHMERGNQLMARGNELFERNNELFVRNVELMDDVREELRLSREQHADLREFVRIQNTRAERVAEAALDYGATAYAFFRSKEDQSVFIQLTFGLESKLDWERYWLSDEVSDARTRATGLFQVPVTPEWQRLVGFDSRALAAVGD